MKVISYTIHVLYPPENDQSEPREEFLHRERLCYTDAEFDDHLAIAKAEAYNGEVTVEEIQDKQQEPSTESVLLELAADHEARLCEIELGV